VRHVTGSFFLGQNSCRGAAAPCVGHVPRGFYAMADYPPEEPDEELAALINERRLDLDQ
jgi:hypothetical protein